MNANQFLIALELKRQDAGMAPADLIYLNALLLITLVQIMLVVAKMVLAPMKKDIAFYQMDAMNHQKININVYLMVLVLKMKMNAKN